MSRYPAIAGALLLALAPAVLAQAPGLADGRYACTAERSAGLQPSQKKPGSRFAGRIEIPEQERSFEITIARRTPPKSCRPISPFTRWTACDATRRLRFSKNKSPLRLYADEDDDTFRNPATYLRLDPKTLGYVFMFHQSSDGRTVDSHYVEEGRCSRRGAGG